MRFYLAMALLLAVTACTQTAEGVQYGGDAAKQVVYDTKKSWRDIFTYNPKREVAPLPQTRYCYKMQSDTVCYDSPQANMTAKLVGYQDGTSVSWIQPGGGSLGVSGGEPTAPHNAEVVQVAPDAAAALPAGTISGGGGMDIDTSTSVDTSVPPVYESAQSTAGCTGTNTPFYCNESPYQKK